MNDFAELRQQMVEHQLEARGLHDKAVLSAINAVPREEFVPTELVEFAYSDSPLPIAASQTISQPYIVALMIAELHLNPDDRVLEVGTGSGYAAAVLAKISKEVYSIERHKVLADSSRERLQTLGFNNVKILLGDGTLGWPEHAPFDAIIVAAGGPEVPEALRAQLAIGGRLVIPIGASLNTQKLVRITRVSKYRYEEELLEDVRFVPLIGAAGWQAEITEQEVEAKIQVEKAPAKTQVSLPNLIYTSSEHFANIDHVNLDNLMKRIGSSRLVLLGEASHGTAEFYDMRSRITKELIEKKGFNIIAAEADWPDAEHINHFVHGTEADPLLQSAPFSRFPTWMWANRSVLKFVQWLKQHNQKFDFEAQQTDFYGLDLYSLSSSIDAVLSYLDSVDVDTAKLARDRYACLIPWVQHPAGYAELAITQKYRGCEKQVLSTLQDLLDKRLQYTKGNSNKKQLFFNAERNAKLVANAERYYRTMYYAENNSWNQRDQHMFETLEAALDFKGANSKAVVWAHNSHLGDARATQMSARGELNIGQLVRQKYAKQVYSIGFGTDHGTVAAASQWGGPVEFKKVQPAHIDSYERLCHEVKTDNFLLPLSQPLDKVTRKKLLPERLERAIGVIYHPQTELQSHYFYACLPQQFDEYIWFDETRAVEPLTKEMIDGDYDTFPFAL